MYFETSAAEAYRITRGVYQERLWNKSCVECATISLNNYHAGPIHDYLCKQFGSSWDAA